MMCYISCFQSKLYIFHQKIGRVSNINSGQKIIIVNICELYFRFRDFWYLQIKPPEKVGLCEQLFVCISAKNPSSFRQLAPTPI